MVDYSKWVCASFHSLKLNMSRLSSNHREPQDNLDVSDDSEAETSDQPKGGSANPSDSRSHAVATANQSSTSNVASTDPPTAEEEEPSRLSPTLQQFANISISDYRASHEFLTAHPELVAKETNSDGLLMKEGFIMALQIDEESSDETEKNEITLLVKQCVHQALLLQYCRLVSPDGRDESAIGGFFMRLIMDGGEGRQGELLMADVETRTGEITALAREAREEQLSAAKEELARGGS